MVWKEMLAAGEPLPRARPMLCLATDSFLRGNLPAAWQSCRRLFEEPVVERRTGGLLDDLTDTNLSVSEACWFQGRLGTLLRDAPPERGEIEAFIAGEAAGLIAADAPDEDRMRRFLEYFGSHPRAMSVRSAARRSARPAWLPGGGRRRRRRYIPFGRGATMAAVAHRRCQRPSVRDGCRC